MRESFAQPPRLLPGCCTEYAALRSLCASTDNDRDHVVQISGAFVNPFSDHILATAFLGCMPRR